MHCPPFSKKSKTLSRPSEEFNINSVISPYKGFENSFQKTDATPVLHVDGNPGKKWSSFGEGFTDSDLQKDSHSDKRSNSTVKKSKSAKRKITELVLPEDVQPQQTGSDDLDQLSTEIKWQSSSDSETEAICPSPRGATLPSSKKGNNCSWNKIRSTSTAAKIKISSVLKRQFCNQPENTDISKFESKSGQTNMLPKPVLSDDNKITSKEDDGSIVSYESEDEEFKEIQKESESERNDFEDISEPSSSTSSIKELQTDHCNKIKAGDWLKSVQWQAVTPTKVSPSKDPDNLGDSAKKKKKKYAKNSMAEQLSKLQIREKSAMSVWYHKTKENLTSTLPASQDSSKSLTVMVTSLNTICSLCVITCHSVTPDSPELRVILPSSSSLLPKLSIGLTIHLLPPWQTLSLPGIGQEIMFCCYYRVINPIPNHPPPHLSEQTPVETYKAVWKCPCVQDDNIDPLRCPAQRIPCQVNLHITSQLRNDRTDVSSSPGDSSTLHTVLASQRSGAASSDSILQSLEKVGHSTTQGLSFQAKIQRIFRRRNDSNTFSRWSILVEDSHGVFAHVSLPDHADHLDNWKEVLLGEGLSVILTGVTLHNRTNRDRDPSLFSVLDSVWKSSLERNAGQEFSMEDSASPNETISRPTPGFCYLLKAWHGRSGVKLQPSTSSTSSLPPGRESQPLKDILQTENTKSEEDKRVNILCKVIFIDKRENSDQAATSTFQESDQSCHVLYVTDQSLLLNPANSSHNHLKSSHNNSPSSTHKSSISLHTRSNSACILPFFVLKSCELSEINIQVQDLIYIRGAYLQHGKLTADEYSRSVHVSSNISGSCLPSIHNDDNSNNVTLQETEFIPEPLTDGCRVGGLVSVSGVICGVNEGECYSWPECDTCGSDRLTSINDNASQLRCLVCKCTIQSPVNRIKMEVCVKSVHLSAEITLQLLEETVHSLLPDNGVNEEYDISSVLGSPIGPLSCILREKLTNQESGIIHLKLQEVEIT